MKPSDEAIYDVFTDLSGNTGWPIPFWPKQAYTLHVNYANILPEFDAVSQLVLRQEHAEDVVVILPNKPGTSISVSSSASPSHEPPSPSHGEGPHGIVRTEGRMMLDDDGAKNFLSTTLMWSVWGFANDFNRWCKNLDYWSGFGGDGIRSLGSVMGDSWEGRKIDPTHPNYEEWLAGMIDTAFNSYGLRQFPFTMLGDHFTDVHAATDRMLRVLEGREEKIGCIEIANEWDHAVKISKEELIAIGKKVRATMPNTLLALSRPRGLNSAEMREWMSQVGGPLFFPRHTERKENDRNWRQVRQGYDFIDDPWTGSHNEPPGPASSVGQLWKPRQHGCMRMLGAWAGCGLHVVHTGNGVRGKDDPANGRKPDLMDIPGFDKIMGGIRMVERWMPPGVQNWKVVNNGPSRRHPMSLPREVGDGFWEGNDDVEKGSCNKNYAVLGPGGKFYVGHFGTNDDHRIGQALYDMKLQAYDTLTGMLAFDGILRKDKWLSLPGRTDREMSYVVEGQRL